jgi:hypothetical protein
MTAIAAEAAFRKALETVLVTFFPDGVNNANYLDFDDMLRDLMSRTLNMELGRYGMLQWIATDAEWATFPGNALDNDQVKQPVAIPEEPEPEPAFPAEGAAQAVHNNYTARIALRVRTLTLRATLVALNDCLYALFVDKRWFSKAVVNAALGPGDAVTRASETCKIRYARINGKLNKPTKATLKT